jgi:large subunit ribosomal protein L13
MKNIFIPSRENSQWFVVDAEGQKLGRLSTTVAQVLRGKHKASYTPYLDMGDYVVIINAEKIEVSGKKETQKLYRRHSGYPGGLTTETLKALRSRIPERIIEKAVKGMLPKGPLGRNLYKKLKVYKGDTHPHLAQQPQKLNMS